MYKLLIYDRFEDIFTDGAGCLIKMFDDYDTALEAVEFLTSTMGFVVVFGKE